MTAVLAFLAMTILCGCLLNPADHPFKSQDSAEDVAISDATDADTGLSDTADADSGRQPDVADADSGQQPDVADADSGQQPDTLSTSDVQSDGDSSQDAADADVGPQSPLAWEFIEVSTEDNQLKVVDIARHNQGYVFIATGPSMSVLGRLTEDGELDDMFGLRIVIPDHPDFSKVIATGVTTKGDEIYVAGHLEAKYLETSQVSTVFVTRFSADGAAVAMDNIHEIRTFPADGAVTTGMTIWKDSIAISGYKENTGRIYYLNLYGSSTGGFVELIFEIPDYDTHQLHALVASGDILRAVGEAGHGGDHKLLMATIDWAAPTVFTAEFTGENLSAGSARGITVDTIGRVLSVGHMQQTDQSQHGRAVLSFTDASYGVLDNQTPNGDRYEACAHDGQQLIAVGTRTSLTNNSRPLVHRYDTDGKLEKSFEEYLPNVSSAAHTVLLGPNGSFIVGGQKDGRFAIWKFASP